MMMMLLGQWKVKGWVPAIVFSVCFNFANLLVDLAVELWRACLWIRNSASHQPGKHLSLPLQGGEERGGQQHGLQDLATARNSRGFFTWASAASGGSREPHGHLHKAPKASECVKTAIETPFQFCDWKLEMGSRHYFYMCWGFGSPAEASAGLLSSWGQHSLR